MDTEAAAKFERHMESCAACRELVSGQKAVWEALDTWETAPVSPDFDRRLYQRIDREVSWFDLLLRPFRPLLLRQGLPVAVAAVVMVTAGVMLDRPANPPAAARGDTADITAQMETLQPAEIKSALDDMELFQEFNHRSRSDSNEPKM